MMTIDELAELEKAATAGPWGSDLEMRHEVFGISAVMVSARGLCVLVAFGDNAETRADARLSVAARNHLPALLEIARVAREVCDRQLKFNGVARESLERALAALEQVK